MPPESPYRTTLRPEDFAPQRGFNISIISFLVYLAGVAVHFFMFGGKERITLIGGPTMWMVIGGYVGIFLVALMVSYFAFAGTRSRIVSAVFFCLSIPALVYGDMKVNSLADAKIKPDTSKLPPSMVAGFPSPSPTPATPKPAVAAAPEVPGNPTYSSGQRQQYILKANEAFVAARDARVNAFKESFAALAAAGGVAAKGLVSREAIAERRKLIAALNTANDESIAFVTNQEAIYRSELQKTALIPNDVDDTVNRFMANSSDVIDKLAVRETEKNLLKASDDVLAAMDRMWGRWRLKGDRAIFEKKADADQYAKLLSSFNTAVAVQTAAQAKLTASGAAAAPEAPPGAPAAAASPVAGAAPTSGKTPMPTPAGSPAASPSASLSTPSSSVGAVVTPVGTPASAVSPTP